MSVLKVKVGNQWVGIPSIKGDTGATGPQGPKGDPGTPADPTVLIDDNVGQGTTNKTWSADKITGEFESVDEKINSGLGAYYIDKNLFANPTTVNSNASSVINAAILTAQEKQLTFCIIPEGEYWLTSTIYLKSNVILCGNGMDSTILKIADGCDIDAIRVSEPTSNAGIMDLAIDGNRIQNYSTFANGHHGNAINVWLHYGILERVRTNWVFKHSLLLNYDTGNSDDGLGFAPEHQNDMGNLNRVLWCDFKDSLLQGIMWGWRTTDSWMCYTNIGSHAANLYLEGGTSRFIGNHFDGDGDNGAGPEYNVYCGDGCDTMFFDENIFENTQKENIYFRKPSYSNKTRTISINNNIIRTCSKTTNNTYANIKIVGYDSDTKASNITIANNQILNPDLNGNHGYAGIHLDYCDDVKIEGNVFYNVGDDRVIVEDTCTNIIFDEEVSNELTTVKSAITHRGIDENSLNNKAYANHVLLEKLSRNQTYLNLFDISSVTANKKIANDGTPATDSSYKLSVFMRVYTAQKLLFYYKRSTDSLIVAQNNNFCAFYDGSYQLVGSVAIGTTSQSVPNGAVFFRIAFSNTSADTAMVFGVPSASTYKPDDFVSFMDGEGNGFKFVENVSKLQGDVAELQGVKDEVVPYNNNVMDWDAIVIGKRPDGSGSLVDDELYVTTDFMKCSGASYLMLVTRNGTNKNPNDVTKSEPGGLGWFFYDADKQYLGVTYNQNQNPATINSAAKYARARFSKSDYTWYANNLKLVGAFYAQNVSDVKQWNFYSDTQYGLLNSAYAVDGSKIHTKNVSCWGDSLTDGSGDTEITGGYVSRLGTKLGANKYNINNFGLGGQNSKGVARHIGAMPVFVKPFTIPADTTAVSVELYDIEGQITSLFTRGSSVASATLHNAAINPCIINGVEGTLTQLDNAGSYTFARLSAGEEIEISRPSLLETWGYRNNRDDITIIWAGTNDTSTGMTVDGYTARNISSIVDVLTHKKYIVLSLISKYVHNDVSSRNITLQRIYGRHFLDIRNYLLTYGLSDNSITPTAQDTTDISNGEIPTSLRSDSIHLNQYGYQAVANAVYKYGAELGYWE